MSKKTCPTWKKISKEFKSNFSFHFWHLFSLFLVLASFCYFCSAARCHTNWMCKYGKLHTNTCLQVNNIFYSVISVSLLRMHITESFLLTPTASKICFDQRLNVTDNICLRWSIVFKRAEDKRCVENPSWGPPRQFPAEAVDVFQMSQLPPVGRCGQRTTARRRFLQTPTQSFQTSKRKYSNHLFFSSLNTVAHSPFSPHDIIILEPKICIKSEKINGHGLDFHTDSKQLFPVDHHVNTFVHVE